MKALNKLLIAVSLMLASTSSFSAVNFGDLSGGAVESRVMAHMSGSFTDTFNFTLSDANNSLGVASENFLWSFMGVDLLNIADFNVELLDGSASSLGDWSGFGAFSHDLTAGSYSLEVTGNVIGAFGGSYALSASAVSPVPEASTLSLMFAGFGLVGFMSYRRRNMI